MLADELHHLVERLALLARLAGLAGVDELGGDDRWQRGRLAVDGLALVGDGVALVAAAAVGLRLRGDAQVRHGQRHVEDVSGANQRALDEKETREQIADLRAQYEADGITVVDWPDYYTETDTAPLRDLQDEDGNALTEENYKGKPGYAVAIGERWGRVEVGHVVVDWKKQCLRKINRGGTVVGGKMTEEEKAARRTLIANNKAWKSAETVRREWLAKFLGRKRLPNDALPYAASVFASETSLLSDVSRNAHALAEKVMGYAHHWGQHPLATLATDTPTKAGHVVIALALGLIEDSTSTSTWRNPGQRDADYFGRLAAWGYHLSEVERIVTGETPDDPDEATSEADAAPVTEEDTTEEVAEVTAETTEPEESEEEPDEAPEPTAEDEPTEDDGDAEEVAEVKPEESDDTDDTSEADEAEAA